MTTFLWVCLAGAAGLAASRLLGSLQPRAPEETAFPLPLLALSAAGALVLGALLHFVLAAAWLEQGVRIALATGGMGGFITHAAFNSRATRYAQRAGWARGAAYILAASTACLAAAMIGLLGARWITAPGPAAPAPAAAPAQAPGGGSERPLASPRVRPPLAATFSIVAFDPKARELGVAVQSHWFSVGSLVPWAEYGVGAVATQSFVEVSYGPEGLRLLREGRPPSEVLRALTAADAQKEFRQVGIVDARGVAASWTGKQCISFAGHKIGPNYSAQGNLLASSKVWKEMGRAFERAKGPLAERLLLALEAGQAAGGDARGMQSAALLVVGPGEEGRPWTTRKIDLRVEDHASPIDELRRVLNLQRAYDLANEGDRLVSEKKFEEAFRAYDRALTLAPGNDELMFWRASMYMQAGKADEALADVRRALALNPRWRSLLERLTPEAFTGAAEILKRLDAPEPPGGR